MIAVDTSVAVAALVAWHEGHGPAQRAAAGAVIPAQARLETYSVLTRLPAPHRLEGDLAAELVTRRFPLDKTITPSARLSCALVERCAEHGLQGGAVYDALVALTASEAGCTLRTRDERAGRAYERLDVTFELVR